MNQRLLVIVLTTIGLFAMPLITSYADRENTDREPPLIVHASDIPARVQIVGTLGRPLGELMTVRGKWQEPPNHKGRIKFLVLEVNGEPIENEVRFSVVRPFAEYFGRDKSPAWQHDDVWEFRAIESGGFAGSPPDALKEMMEPGGEVSQGSHAGYFSFDTHLEYASWKKISRKEKQPSRRQAKRG